MSWRGGVRIKVASRLDALDALGCRTSEKPLFTPSGNRIGRLQLRV
jgi:hypothetical protein